MADFKKEDTWNLAEQEHFNFHKDDIKTFIHKVKEDIMGLEGDKDKECICHFHAELTNKIIDKRAGNL